MNFSTPLNFQANFNYPAAYYPQTFPQVSEGASAPRFHNVNDIRQSQDGLWLGDQESFTYEPVKKIKGPSRPDLDAGSIQNYLMNQVLRNETINRNDMTSLIDNKHVSGANYFGQRLTPAQAQAFNREMAYSQQIQGPYTRGINEEVLLQLDPRMLQEYENSFMMYQQAASNRDWPAGVSQQGPGPIEMQLNLLQNLQQQLNQSQKAYEQFILANFNSVNQTPAQMNQSINPYQQRLNEQPDMEMFMQAQNILRMEQEAQRAYNEIILANKQSKNIEEFPEILFDTNLLMQGSNEAYRQEVLKLKEFEDFDDKRTADSSNSEESILCKEFPDGYPFNFQAEIKAQKKFINNNNNVQPNGVKSVKQRKEIGESLLKKRPFDLIDTKEKITPEKFIQKPIINKTSPPKDKKFDRKPQLDKVQPLETQTLTFTQESVKSADMVLNPCPAVEEALWNVDSDFFAPTLSTLSPPQARAKKQKPKATSSPTVEVKPVKRERKMNKLQTMRVAMDNYIDELKKPYVIHLHFDPTDPEQRVAQTRVGQEFQVEDTIVNAQDGQRKRRTIKSLWDPSLVQNGNLDEFYANLKEIFGQEVSNQEAALKILRGTGMDINGTIDIIKRNNLYFKGILFPEPKGTKTQRP